jgi:hypothetical protein
MPTFTLTDVAKDLWVESLTIDPDRLGIQAAHPWSVSKTALRGGRRDGVDLIQVHNGALSFAVIPTRGMGIWKARYQGDRVGWDSPVRDGPVNPSFVNLMSWGGLGWLDGFDELLARCGLENNGAPYEVKVAKADGSESHTTYPLHGRIANTPASYVAVQIGDGREQEITVEGRVEESKLFGPQIRMTTWVTTVPGSNRVTVRDEFENLKETPTEMQVLYHWNFGPPHLEEGSRLVAPAKTVVPIGTRAQEGIGHYDIYGAPEPGFAEQVYLIDLYAGPRQGQTLAMLCNRAGDKGVALRFGQKSLPCFTLWKRTGGRAEGYVTGLEPGTNYPHPKPFEKARGRVVTLPPGGRYETETSLEVLSGQDAVAAVAAEVKALMGKGGTDVRPAPEEPFAARH